MAGWLPLGIAASAPSYLSDSYSGATVLLSLSKESASYSGACVKVRRASDNATQDIGFVGKVFDVAAFNTFKGASTCFVDTWYDESGNANDAVQATTGKQPQLIINGDGKPELDFSAGGKSLKIAESSTYKTAKVHIFTASRWSLVSTAGTTQIIATYMGTGEYGSNAAFGTSVARWGFASDGGPGFMTPLNATFQALQEAVGNAARDVYQIYDMDTETRLIKQDGVSIQQVTANTDVSYPGGTRALMIGSNFDGTQNFLGQMRAVVIYGTTRADRAGIASFIKSYWSVSDLVTTETTADGFTWDRKLVGSQSDVGLIPTESSFGLDWYRHNGGYLWSCHKATNVNAGGDLWRFEARDGDFDLLITQSQRTELMTADAAVSPGGTKWLYFQYMPEAGTIISTSSGRWLAIFQQHYSDDYGISALYAYWLDDKLTFYTEDSFANGKNTTTRYQSGVLTRGIPMGLLIKYKWAGDGSTDTCEVWHDVATSTNMAKVVNLSTPQGIFGNNASGKIIYDKIGIYRGPDGFSGLPDFAIRHANYAAGSSSLASRITSQPAWPTHA